MTKKIKPNLSPYILSLDLGVRSVGWAIIDTEKGNPVALRDAGSRIFEAGVEGDIEQGKDSSRAAVRREKRAIRRLQFRRSRRLQKLFLLLRDVGLLPSGGSATPEQRHDLLLKLDQELRMEHCADDDRVQLHLLPYILRSKGIDQKLKVYELGRALYHLAQRRGYLSNRKADREDDDERGKVATGISELSQLMNGRTLGQYFATLDPEEIRIRQRWTSRQMYRDEFEKIVTEQAKHHNFLDDELKRKMYLAIFFQRPLRSQKHLIGRCSLEHDKKRCNIAHLLAQEFRLLQTVNNLIIHFPDHASRPLDDEERDRLIETLKNTSVLKFSDMRKILELPRGSKFNLEFEGNRLIPGNKTRAAMLEVFGVRWDEFSESMKDQIVYEVLNYQKPHALERRGKERWELNSKAAHRLSEARLEQGYANHSKQALRKLVKTMRTGVSYSTARKELYPESFQSEKPRERLRPVANALPDLRNPAVMRTLTELRKVVNALLGKHGKPELIRIELTRDLKRSKKERKSYSERNYQNQKRREKAKETILKEFSGYNPRRSDIEKVLLAEECNWECPYTGRRIEMRTLLGPEPQFDVEHIFPRKYLDDSFLNKTLCYHEENRNVKRGRTPYEAYADESNGWNEIIGRVKKFQGTAMREKVKRFLMKEISDDFVERQLNDTRYTSSQAADYLAELYGGRTDESGIMRIHTIPGGRITAFLRNEWYLNSILGDGGQKSRDDHRHHAIDAIVVGLTDWNAVRKLEQAAEKASDLGSNKMFVSVKDPFPGFLDQTRDCIESIFVSHRMDRKLNGLLHADTLYSKPKKDRNGEEVVHIRKRLEQLSISEIKSAKIVDPVIRELVTKKYEQLGGGNPAKTFEDRANHPFLLAKDGRNIPIHKVRIQARANPWKIGTKSQTRYVAAKAGSNHHTVIVAQLDEHGNEVKWIDHCISRFDASQRKVHGLPVVQRDWEDGCCFKFSLAPKDSLIMADEEGNEQLYVVSSISQGDYTLRLHNDARTMKEIKKLKKNVRITNIDKFRKRHARKVSVGPLGDLFPAND